MKYLKLLCMAAAILMTACNKNGNNDNTPAKTTDENGVTSVLIREKDKGDFAKEIDITIKLSDITSTIEVKTDPAEVVSQISYESEDVLIVRVTRQGNLYARRAGSTKVNVKIGETVYATANVTVVDEDASKDPEVSSDPSDGPKEKKVLDKYHWFFYCWVCDRFESIAKTTAHSAANQFATWAPSGLQIVLVEDPENPDGTLLYGYDDFSSYSYASENSDSFEFEDPDWGGEGILFYLNPEAPYVNAASDPFVHSQLTLKYEDDDYVAEDYSANGSFRGLTGWMPQLEVNVRDITQGKWHYQIFKGSTEASLTFSKGTDFRIALHWNDGQYIDGRSKTEAEGTIFSFGTGGKGVAVSSEVGVDKEGYWNATVHCQKAGETDLTIASAESRGPSRRVIHLTVTE